MITPTIWGTTQRAGAVPRHRVGRTLRPFRRSGQSARSSGEAVRATPRGPPHRGGRSARLDVRPDGHSQAGHHDRVASGGHVRWASTNSLLWIRSCECGGSKGFGSPMRHHARCHQRQHQCGLLHDRRDVRGRARVEPSTTAGKGRGGRQWRRPATHGARRRAHAAEERTPSVDPGGAGATDVASHQRLAPAPRAA